MQLDNKQCEAFMAVVATGSFEQAGNLLYLTPSAISLRVQALEQALATLLLHRQRPCILTPSGEKLHRYLQQQQRLEQQLLHSLSGRQDNGFHQIKIASNADSLATWLLPALQESLINNKIMIEILLADQAHTYALLASGQADACLSIEATPMKGCEAIFLGNMDYELLASPKFYQTWFTDGVNRTNLSLAPAIIFNDKDYLHFDVLAQNYGLLKGSFPYSMIPSSESFVHAIELGLGYGMIPVLQAQPLLEASTLVKVANHRLSVGLYWHYWQQQSEPMARLTHSLQVNSYRYLS